VSTKFYFNTAILIHVVYDFFLALVTKLIGVTLTISYAKFKIFSIWLFTEKLDDSCSKWLFLLTLFPQPFEVGMTGNFGLTKRLERRNNSYIHTWPPLVAS
jgi:hypothetical protein